MQFKKLIKCSNYCLAQSIMIVTADLMIPDEKLLVIIFLLTRTMKYKQTLSPNYILKDFKKQIPSSTNLIFKYNTVTCHVAVNFQRSQCPTAIWIYPVVIWSFAQVFVCFTREFINSWNEIKQTNKNSFNLGEKKFLGQLMDPVYIQRIVPLTLKQYQWGSQKTKHLSKIIEVTKNLQDIISTFVIWGKARIGRQF